MIHWWMSQQHHVFKRFSNVAWLKNTRFDKTVVVNKILEFSRDSIVITGVILTARTASSVNQIANNINRSPVKIPSVFGSLYFLYLSSYQGEKMKFVAAALLFAVVVAQVNISFSNMLAENIWLLMWSFEIRLRLEICPSTSRDPFCFPGHR